MWHSGAAGIRHAVKTGWAHASPAPLHYLNPGLNLNMPHVLMSSAYGPLLFPAIKKRNVSEGWKRGGVERPWGKSKCVRMCVIPAFPALKLSTQPSLFVQPRETQGQGADLTLTGPRCVLVSPSITALQLLLTHGLLSQPDCVRQHTLCEQAGFRRTRQRGSDELTGRVINPFNPTGHNSDCKKGFHI